ncbi:MAG: phosphoribosylglycinamide formyltransferase [Actinomycetota bacterium]
MRVAVLASGSGTILHAMIDASVPIALILTDRECKAESIAATNQIIHQRVERKNFGKDFDRNAYTCDITNTLQTYDIDLVVMAGFGTILDQPIYDAFHDRVLNTHPSLLPSFPGWHAVADALHHGVKVTGCTVHVATKEVDAGPILAQEAVPIFNDDTEETLHERIKVVERRLYVTTVQEIIKSNQLLERET